MFQHTAKLALSGRSSFIGALVIVGLFSWAGESRGQVSGTATRGARAEPIPLCSKIPDGDFNNGFGGWIQDPCPAGFGDYASSANASIEDLTSIGCDQDVACLNIFAESEWTCEKPSGSASQAQMSIERTAVVRGRYLKFKAVGSFEFTVFAKGMAKYNAQIVVTNEDGIQVKCDLLNYDFAADLECESGLAALGAIPLETICCDLQAGGILIGDTVTIEVVWSATTIACNECDISQFFGSLCVDNFQFCNACLQPAGPIQPVQVVTSTIGKKPTPALDPLATPEERLLETGARLGVDMSAGTAGRDSE